MDIEAADYKLQNLTLKMTCTQLVETSVINNSPSQDSNHPDDLFQSSYVTPGFKPLIKLTIFQRCHISHSRAIKKSRFRNINQISNPKIKKRRTA